MKQKVSVFKILEAFILLFLTPFSLVYSQQVTLEKLVKNSDVIVIGKVIKIECKIEKGKNIWTYVTLECKQYIKGNERAELTVRIPGGEVGDLGQYVSGTPKYKVGEEVLNFLEQDTMGTYHVNGWKNGKYSHKNGNWIQNNSKQPDSFISKLESMVNLK